MASPVKILLVLFPGFNTLDMNGPYEVLRKSKGGDLFTITVAAESEITTSCEGVHVKVRIHLLAIAVILMVLTLSSATSLLTMRSSRNCQSTASSSSPGARPNPSKRKPLPSARRFCHSLRHFVCSTPPLLLPANRAAFSCKPSLRSLTLQP